MFFTMTLFLFRRLTIRALLTLFYTGFFGLAGHGGGGGMESTTPL